MKRCPNCQAALDDNARFCLCCMTSLDEKECIAPPAPKPRRWPLVLLCALGLCGLLVAIVLLSADPPENTADKSLFQPAVTQEAAEDSIATAPEDPNTISQTQNGVTYTFRPAVREDHPTAVTLENHYVLIRVEGATPDGVYQVPSFVGQDLSAIVSVVADGAFAETNAQAIDLGYNVRYVWGNAFGSYPLKELYLHEDVWIDQAAFDRCTESLTIHCPEYLENTEGTLWCDLAATLGFRWQPEAI